jgi:hypothetical protein
MTAKAKKYGRCPHCGKKFDREGTRAVSCREPECRAAHAKAGALRFYQAKLRFVNALIRTGCFFAYLDCCNGELTTNRKDGKTLDELFTEGGVVNMRKAEIARIIGTTVDYIVLCRRHQCMVTAYYRAHESDSTSEKLEGAILYVIDKETEKHDDEREEP